MKCVIYNRVSTTEQNPELQLKECNDFAFSKGWFVKEVYTEQKSAFKDESQRTEFNRMLEDVKKGGIDFILVWNMDRFSRQPEEYVMRQIRELAFIGVKVVAVHGDVWSQLVESIGTLKSLGTMGEAILEFLEKIIRALEYQRAYRESKTKSERVRLAVRQKDGKTVSYKGNKWGRKGLPKQTVDRILELKRQYPKMSLRDFVEHPDCYQYDKSGNKKPLSIMTISRILRSVTK